VAYLGFCEGGGRAKDARFEAPEAPIGWTVGRGCPLPIEEGVWGGGCAPCPEILKKILVQCVQKFFSFRPRGGHCPVAPLNTPLVAPMASDKIEYIKIRAYFSRNNTCAISRPTRFKRTHSTVIDNP